MFLYDAKTLHHNFISKGVSAAGIGAETPLTCREMYGKMEHTLKLTGGDPMKRLLPLILTLALLVSLAVPALAFTVVVSNQALSVNGQAVDCEKYRTISSSATLPIS